MSDYWFGPKRIGYGIRPQNWKGWLTLLLLIAAVAALAIVFLPKHNLVAFIIGLIIALVVFFIVVAFKKQPKQSGG